MALQGSLGQLGLADLLQTGLAGGAGGHLHLSCGAQRAVLYVSDEGLRLLEPDVLDPNDVLRAFIDTGVLDDATIQAQGRSAQQGGLELLDALLLADALKEADLFEILASVAEDTILDLLTWEHGTFRFDEGMLDNSRIGLVGRIVVDSGGVLLRAAQRVDERSAIARDLGLHATLFMQTGVPAPEPEEEEDYSLPVLAALDGVAVVDEIALQLGLGRFDVLKASHALLQAGAARMATPEELAYQAEQRLGLGQLRAARMLCLQWNEGQPTEPAPLQMLIEVSSRRGNLGEELAAGSELGTLFLQQQRPGDALQIFQQALSKTRFHEDLLQGLRLAAQATGDNGAFTDATTRLAEAALEAGDGHRAAHLADELVRADPENVRGFLLRGRAAVRLGNKEMFVETAEQVAQSISGRALTHRERELSVFFHDTLERLAPERGDLAQQFRGGTQQRTRRSPHAKHRRVTLVGALLVLVASAGFLLWPASASSMLAEAQAALQKGDSHAATMIIAKLIEEYPESTEAETAFRMRTSMLTPTPTTSQPVATAPSVNQKQELETHLKGLLGALEGLPSKEARDLIASNLAWFEANEDKRARQRLSTTVGPALIPVVRRIERQARERRDLIARARMVAHREGRNADALRSYLAEVEAAQDPTVATELERTRSLLERMLAMQSTDSLSTALSGLDTAIKTVTAPTGEIERDLDEVRLLLAGLDLDAAQQRCNQEAAALLTEGKLDEADAIHAALEELIKRIDGTDELEPLREEIDRRRLRAYVSTRRSRISSIKEQIASAQALEARGEFDAAADMYGALVREHWQIRLENVFTVPLRVASIPAGARVTINGQLIGRSPCMVRYRWGSRTLLRLDAPGYKTLVHVMEKRGDRPETKLTLALEPSYEWRQATASGLRLNPLRIGTDVMTYDRNGRFTRYSATDGSVRWARHHKTLEGIRTAPVLADEYIYATFVDGRVMAMHPADGQVAHEASAGRPVGEMAAYGNVAAVASQRGKLFLLQRGKVVRQVELGIAPTAGVLSAHGFFWVGGASGEVLRVDARTQVLQRMSLEGTRAAIRGIGIGPAGVHVTTSDGRLYALDVEGRQLWMQRGLGDILGAPAYCRGHVAVVGRRGRVYMFEQKDGTPAGTEDLGGLTNVPLISVGSCFLASRSNGRLWAWDVETRLVRIDTMTEGGVHSAVALGSGRFVVSVPGKWIMSYRLPPVPPQDGEGNAESPK
jgi:tetratricopeptide (TPR) repeat protein